MFKTTVTYKDFNGNEHVEELHFHMMAPEFADLQFNPTFENGLGEYVREAMKSGDGQKVYTFFKLMMVNSYGRRSEDGSRFVKKPEFTEDFLNSNAYEEFFMWLIGDPKNAEAFWNGIVPEKIVSRVEQLESQGTGDQKKRLQDMSKEELVAMMQAKVATNAIAS